VNGAVVQARGPETPDGLVLVVREPNAGELLTALDPGLNTGRTWSESLQIRRTNSLDVGTTMRYVWPIAQHYDAAGHVPSAIFVSSANVRASDAGMLWFLTRRYDAAVLDPTSIAASPTLWPSPASMPSPARIAARWCSC